MIILAFIAFAVGIIAMLVAGSLRAFFELVLIFDNHESIKRNDFFNKSKDRNNDGKLSWFELTFPDEPLHRVKRHEIVLYAVGLTFFIGSMLIIFSFLNWLSLWPLIGLAVITPIVFFAATGFGFDSYFKENRP